MAHNEKAVEAKKSENGTASEITIVKETFHTEIENQAQNAKSAPRKNIGLFLFF